MSVSGSILSQCLDEDIHSNSLHDSWLSCETSASPIDGRQQHWIMYQFEKSQTIKAYQIWNFNHKDNLLNGTKDLHIAISNDGQNWQSIDSLQLDIATGDNTYVGSSFERSDPIQTKYILLLAVNNYGGSCTGLAEVKFILDNVSTATDEENLSSNITVSPMPFSSSATITLPQNVDNLNYTITDLAGTVMVAKQERIHGSSFEVDGSAFPTGIYFIQLKGEGFLATKKLIIVHP